MKCLSKNLLNKISLFLGITLVLVDWCGHPRALEGEEAHQALFRKAQETYNKAQSLNGDERQLAMLKAAAQFELLVDKYGIENGYLFYNTGNAYYEAGKPGRAILNYRRAERLIPGFRDLQYNLNLVRGEVTGPEEVSDWWDEIVKNLVFWHYMLDFSTRRWITIISFVLIWGFLIAAIFFQSAIIKTGIVLSTLVMVGVGGSFLHSLYQLNAVSAGVTIEEQTTARKGPGFTYETIYQQSLPEGTEFEVIEEQGEWWKIRLVNDDEAWIPAKRAETI